MRNAATRQLVSFRAPFSRRYPSLSQVSRNRRGRFIPGVVRSALINSISSRRKITSAVAHRSTRVAPAEDMFMGAQCLDRLVKTRPATLEHGDAGLAITLGPKVAAELAEHPQHLAEDRRGTCEVVEQPIRCLCAGPRAARFIDRRTGRLGQIFRGFHQVSVQTFVVLAGAGQLLSHPRDRLCAGLHHCLPVRTPQRPDLRTQSTYPRRTPRRQPPYAISACVFSTSVRSIKQSAAIAQDEGRERLADI